MIIRKSIKSDFSSISSIFDEARGTIAKLGIDQWQDGYPQEHVICDDIERENSYVICDGEEICGTFVMFLGGEPTYDKIYDGSWITGNNENRYITVHRVAISVKHRGRGIAREMISYISAFGARCGSKSVRIDTHEGNVVMRKMLEKNGFKHCGMIYLKNGDPRVAYELVLDSKSEFVVKSDLMDEAAVRRSLTRMTHEIIEKNKGTDDICIVGIKRRGVPLANILAENILKFEGINVPVGYIDITFYRDDLTEVTELPEASDCFIPVDIKGKKIILVDDVIYTGRTVRAAIEAIFSFGRPSLIQLAVLIDRGHRELPIRPDFVGKNIPTSKEEMVSVMVDEFDGCMAVKILKRAEATL